MNLKNTFSGDKNSSLGIRTNAQRRLTTEILILGYMGGIITMPGANQQFQFWFTGLVPIVIEMVGLPSILTFWVPHYFYPIINNADPKYQHFFLMGLVGWLYTVGPRRNLVTDALALVGYKKVEEEKEKKEKKE